MRAFIGAKIVLAEPMDENTFISKYKHKETEGKTQLGYHVVYANPDGEYHSWSPEYVFENAYREVTDGEVQMITELEKEELTLMHHIAEKGPEFVKAVKQIMDMDMDTLAKVEKINREYNEKT